MTSIKLRNLPRAFRLLNHVPEFLRENEIIVVSGRLGVLQETPLSSPETDRARSMSSPEARERFTTARRILRSVLSQWTSVPPADLEIVTDEYGKPLFATDDPIHFSITHSSDRVAIAFSRDRVGLDLECVRHVDAHALAARFFPKEEATLFKGSVDPSLFFKLWTCREAAIKGDGRGLAQLLGITRVATMGDGMEGPVEVLIGSGRWDVLPWRMEGDVHGALAFQGKPTLISWCDLR